MFQFLTLIHRATHLGMQAKTICIDTVFFVFLWCVFCVEMVLNTHSRNASNCFASYYLGDAEISALPVTSYGQPVSADGDYVLHFPAGVPISTPVVIGGNLFDASDEKLLTVTPVMDIYSYKDWVSFDGRHWLDARKALDLKLDLVLPGYRHSEAGHFNLMLNRRTGN